MRALIIILIGVIGGIALLNLTKPTSEEQTARLIQDERPVGGDFTLTSNQGPISLSDFKGKLVLAYFGYTFCPDICPTNLSNLSMAYQQLTPEDKANLQILFISVDPQRDTPQRLQEYANYFNANIVGLTGDKKTIDEIAHRYGVIYAIHQEDLKDQHYSVDHSAFTYIINQQGQLINQLPHATSPDQFIEVIQKYTQKQP